MALSFDVTSRTDFLSSALDLGEDVPELIFGQLQSIQNKAWNDFVVDHRWTPIAVVAMDSFPGAPDYHSFFLTIQPGRVVTIAGFLNEPGEVFCAVAVKLSTL